MKKLLLLLLLVTTPSLAKNKEDVQFWIPINTNVKVNENVRLFLELQPRIQNDASQLNTAIVRPAIGWAFDNRSSAWIGYGMQASSKQATPNDYAIEHRIWQGYSYKSNILDDNFTLEMRNRLEERFIPNNSDISIRWRTRFRGEYIFPNYRPWSVISSEEIFVNVNDNSYDAQLQSGPAQNRAYIGVGYRFNPTAQVEFGYLNQIAWGYDGKDDQVNHVIATNINLNF